MLQGLREFRDRSPSVLLIGTVAIAHVNRVSHPNPDPKNDITAATLTQIIFESEKKASQYAPLFTLREIIQNANGSISSYLAKLGAFPKDYIEKVAQQPQPAMVETKPAETKASFDDVKQTLENRVAQAATGNQEPTLTGKPLAEETTPHLPNSNKSLNP